MKKFFAKAADIAPKFWAVIISLIMACAFVFGACSENTDTEDPTPEPTPSVEDEYTLERSDDEKQITFYFNRKSGDYSKCDVWLWYDGADGRGYIFHDCDYGGKAIINVPDTVTEVGFIVRTNCSDPGGTSWGEATKDATESDRSASLTGEETTYYLKEGEAILYTSEDGGKTLTAMMKTVMGDIVTLNTVKFTLNSSLKVTSDMVEIKDGDGNEIGVESVNSPGGITGTITLASELDITKTYTMSINGMEEVALVPSTYFSSDEFNDKYSYDGELGVELTENSTTFRLWAPTASKVVLNLYKDGSTGSAERQIELTRGDEGVWSYSENQSLAGKYYTYSVTTSLGEQEAVDPYARSAGLNGKRGMIIDLDTTDPVGWSNKVFDNSSFTNYTDAVIWEVQVRDFSSSMTSSKYQGKYLAFTETGLTNDSGISVGVDYLKDLGVTHVHLMPCFDYASVDESSSSGYNWGYDPLNYNVPEGSYSTDPSDGAVRVNEFKQMVQSLHNAGLSVVMDVVYNHTYSSDSSFNKIVPYYYYRYNGSGELSNGSGCGNETASDRYMYRKFMVDSVTYWMEEYGVDGFRFDLMGLHDIETMQAIEEAVHAINPKAIIYGEGWTGGTSALADKYKSNLANIQSVNSVAQTNGVAMFNDVLRDAVKGSTNGSDTGFATGAVASNAEKVKFGVTGGVKNSSFTSLFNSWTALNPTNMINYVSAHDNLALWDKICYAYGEDDSTLEMRLRRNALSAAIVYTSLGIPFMQAGEEMLRSKKNADGTYNNNSYNAGDKVNSINWNSLTADSEQYRMSRYYKGLIELRKSSAALRSVTAFDENGQSILSVVKQDGTLIAFTVFYGGETLFIVYNAGESDVSLTLPEGSWSLLANENEAGSTPIKTNLSGDITVAAVSCYVYKKA